MSNAKRMKEIMAAVSVKLGEAEAALAQIAHEEIGPDGMDAAALEELGEAFGRAVFCRKVIEHVTQGCMEAFGSMKAAEAAIDRGLERAKAGNVPHSPPLGIA